MNKTRVLVVENEQAISCDLDGRLRRLGYEVAGPVDSGEAAVAFALHPVSVTDLMAIADAGGIMPPKSTWFEPKLRDGLLTHVI